VQKNNDEEIWQVLSKAGILAIRVILTIRLARKKKLGDVYVTYDFSAGDPAIGE
jgi:hypothetical protein